MNEKRIGMCSVCGKCRTQHPSGICVLCRRKAERVVERNCGDVNKPCGAGGQVAEKIQRLILVAGGEEMEFVRLGRQSE